MVSRDGRHPDEDVQPIPHPTIEIMKKTILGVAGIGISFQHFLFIMLDIS